MKTYFTADPHFGHKRIIELTNRPFNDVDEMNMHMLSKINETVSSDDQLVILGDVLMGKLDESLPILGRIKAKKVIILPGNHDRFSLAYRHSGDIWAQQAKREAFRLRYEAQREGIEAWPDGLYYSAWLGYRIFGRDHPLSWVWLSHFPYQGDSHDEDRYFTRRVPDNEFSPIIHGHVHEAWRTNGRQFNVGVDVNDFTPVSEDELIAWVETIKK